MRPDSGYDLPFTHLLLSESAGTEERSPDEPDFPRSYGEAVIGLLDADRGSGCFFPRSVLQRFYRASRG